MHLLDPLSKILQKYVPNSSYYGIPDEKFIKKSSFAETPFFISYEGEGGGEGGWSQTLARRRQKMTPSYSDLHVKSSFTELIYSQTYTVHSWLGIVIMYKIAASSSYH
jgi:hypothetical protein